MTRKFGLVFAGVVALSLQAAPDVASAAAGSFPDKEIRVVTGFPAGSTAELTLRALVQAAQKYIDQPLIIVNKPGGGQTIAMTELATSPPDGYTIGMTTDTFKSLTAFQHKLRFDPDVLDILLGYAQFQHVLFVRGDSPYKKYGDYIAHAKANPGKMTYGGTGVGTTPDLLGKVLGRAAGVDLNYVVFKGSNEYIPAVLGGHVASGIIAISGISQQVKDGSLAVVLAFGDDKLKGFPDVPTASEVGIKDDLSIFDTVLSIVTHRDVPPERKRLLHDAFRKAAEDPQFRQAMEPTGLKVKYIPGEQVEKRIEQAKKIGVPLLKELNLLVSN